MTALEAIIRRKQFAGIGSAPPHLVIENLEISIELGEFVCVLGPSGCGKSTLLNLISGLDRDYDGEVRFDSGVGDHLAYVFQSPRLLPWRTVAQNIELVLPSGADVSRIVGELLLEAGLGDFAEAFPGQLSLGMQKRAALARANAMQPRLLLMDEPFVSLDEKTAGRLRNLFTTMHRARKTTVLFVTHDSREAVMLADRLIVLAASPCRVVRQVDVDLDPRQRADPQCVEAFRNRHLQS